MRVFIAAALLFVSGLEFAEPPPDPSYEECMDGCLSDDEVPVMACLIVCGDHDGE